MEKNKVDFDDNNDLLQSLMADVFDIDDAGGGVAASSSQQIGGRKKSPKSSSSSSSFRRVNGGAGSMRAAAAGEEVSYGGDHQEMIQVEEEGDSSEEEDFASDLGKLDSFLTQRGVSVTQMPLDHPEHEIEEGQGRAVVDTNEAKLVSGLSPKASTASATGGIGHGFPPSTAAAALGAIPPSAINKTTSVDSRTSIGTTAASATSTTSNRPGNPSPVNVVAPRSPGPHSSINLYGHSSADEASVHSADYSDEPFSPPFSPKNWGQPLSASPHSLRQTSNKEQQQRIRPSTTGDLPRRRYFGADDEYDGEAYEEYDGEGELPSPSRSAATLLSLRLDLDRGGSSPSPTKGRYASIKEALHALTQYDKKPTKKMDLRRVMKIAEPRKLKIDRQFGTDEEERNCYFQPRRSDKALAAAAACGYDFARDKDEGEGNDKANAFLRRTDVAEKKRRAELEFARGEADYAARLDKKWCPSCDTAQSYNEVLDKRKKCSKCGAFYRPRTVFNRKEWAKRLEAGMVKTAKRRAALKRRVLTEVFGSIRNVPKDELANDSVGLAAAAPIPSPAGKVPGGRRQLSPLILRRRSSSRPRAAAASPERKALNEVRKLLEEAESDGESRIDVQKLKKLIVAAAAAGAGGRKHSLETVPAAAAAGGSRAAGGGRVDSIRAVTPSVGPSTRSSFSSSISIKTTKDDAAASDKGGVSVTRRRSYLSQGTNEAENVVTEADAGSAVVATSTPTEDKRKTLLNPNATTHPRRRSSASKTKEVAPVATAAAASSKQSNVDEDIPAPAQAEKIFQKLLF